MRNFFSKKTKITMADALITAFILGLLAAVFIPNFTVTPIRAVVAKTKSELMSISIAVEAYYSDHGTYPAMRPPEESMQKVKISGESGWN